MTFSRTRLRIFSMCLTLTGVAGCAGLQLHNESTAKTGAMTNVIAPMVDVSEGSEMSRVEVTSERMKREEVKAARGGKSPAAGTSRIFYPKWAAGTCVNDGQSPFWGRLQYDDAAACCNTHFSWKYDTCLEETGSTPREETASTLAADGEAVAESMAVAVDGCPAGWTPMARDCDDAQSRAMHCGRTLPAEDSLHCEDGADSSDALCLRTRGELAATWCVNPNPIQTVAAVHGYPYGPRAEDI